MSDDGRAVVGQSWVDDVRAHGFRWTTERGMVSLGDVPGGIEFSQASTKSADGSLIGGFGNGTSGPEYVLWDEAGGVRLLSDAFRDAGLDFGGCQLTAPAAVNRWAAGALQMSGDGLTFTGTVINPQGQQEAWVAVVPEPGSAFAMVVASLCLLRLRRQHRA